jgi:invasion protein IalB
MPPHFGPISRASEGDNQSRGRVVAGRRHFEAGNQHAMARITAAPLLIGLALAAAPLAAVAQEATDAPAAAPGSQSVQLPEGAAWVKLCNSDAQTKKELCLVLQELRAETGQFIASATIRQITGDPKRSFIVAVPPGMLIQPGLRAQIDGGKQYQLKYGICFTNACYAELDIDDEFINAMKNGNQVIITTLNQQAKGVTFPMTLAGFTKAFDGKGLDPQEAQAHQEELNKALQARAEETRKKLIEQQKKEAAAPQ